MELINPILIIVGLAICFGAIYAHRLFAALMGFVWGVIGTLLVILIIGGTRNLNDSLIVMLAIGAIVALLCALFPKICAFLGGLLATFTFVIILLMVIDIGVDEGIALVIALVLALLVAIICVAYHEYAFIIITAFTGAFIACIGIFGIMEGYDPGEVIAYVLWRGYGNASLIPIGTLVLGIAGFFVQLAGLRSRRRRRNGNKMDQ